MTGSLFLLLVMGFFIGGCRSEKSVPHEIDAEGDFSEHGALGRGDLLDRVLEAYFFAINEVYTSRCTHFIHEYFLRKFDHHDSPSINAVLKLRDYLLSLLKGIHQASPLDFTLLDGSLKNVSFNFSSFPNGAILRARFAGEELRVNLTSSIDSEENAERFEFVFRPNYFEFLKYLGSNDLNQKVVIEQDKISSIEVSKYGDVVRELLVAHVEEYKYRLSLREPHSNLLGRSIKEDFECIPCGLWQEYL